MMRVAVTIGLAVAWHVAATPRVAGAQSPGIVATVTYTGSLGPVSSERPLCLCVYTEPTLQRSIGCFISWDNPARFQIAQLTPIDYFLIAFLDLDESESADHGEPLQIYHDRTEPPGDPVTAGLDPPTIDMTFGDESLTPTATPSATPTETPTPTAPASPPPTPIPCAGDCDGSGEVTVDELLILVNIALGDAPLQACAGADTDASKAIEITEIFAAVNNAISSCPE